MKLYSRSFPSVLTGNTLPLVKVRHWVLAESHDSMYGAHSAVSTIRVLPALVSTVDA